MKFLGILGLGGEEEYKDSKVPLFLSSLNEIPWNPWIGRRRGIQKRGKNPRISRKLIPSRREEEQCKEKGRIQRFQGISFLGVFFLSLLWNEIP